MLSKRKQSIYLMNICQWGWCASVHRDWHGYHVLNPYCNDQRKSKLQCGTNTNVSEIIIIPYIVIKGKPVGRDHPYSM